MHHAGAIGTRPELLGGGTQIFVPNPDAAWIL